MTVDPEASGLIDPAVQDVLRGCQATQDLAPTGIVVRVDRQLDVCP